ncbi:gluconate 2-dehydrogenase subunit 3 family protein [Streptomyces sp. A7024]|uniref:Gluconate 2-dehydrogenase subunit 3 family protein n=1 Tax=Streptomyces coryli TaxID=1128680 RepID=A0A6G4U9H7_9ACTN|nr:gluconate 2-dehydrogenase subunit 3 family protein [Streptomyces coryli]NGN68346.1 gluconate 2-dehydrogenase subunit 3 family protein [Streptomyces coryli]
MIPARTARTARLAAEAKATRKRPKRIADRAHTWDPATAGVVLARLGPRPPLGYFSPTEEAAARPLLAHLLATWHDEADIPVLSFIDERLASGEGDGWRHAGLPEDGPAWRRSLAALDADASLRHGRTFAELGHGEQHRLLRHIQDLGSHDWYGMPAARVWSLWTRYACAAYYSHPHSWDETGYGGPAYPQGYLRLGRGTREPWEAPR